MDALQELINKAIDERLKKSDCVASIPCRVVNILNNGYYVVEDIKNGAKYTVPNFSGSAINVGENAQLFFKGGVITNKSAYIGAVNYKNSDSASPVILYGLNTLGEVIGENATISSFKFEASQSTNLLIGFNANVFGTIAGELSLKINVDQTVLSHKPKTIILENGYNLAVFTLPLACDSGEHMVSVVASGTGNFVDVCSYIYGLYIEE